MMIFVDIKLLSTQLKWLNFHDAVRIVPDFIDPTELDGRVAQLENVIFNLLFHYPPPNTPAAVIPPWEKRRNGTRKTRLQRDCANSFMFEYIFHESSEIIIQQGELFCSLLRKSML